MRPPRVLFVTGHWPPAQGGMATSADRIVAGLRADGVWVDVLHLSGRALADRQARMSGGREWVWPVGPELPEDLAELLPALHRWNDAWNVVVAFGGPLPIFAAPTVAACLRLPMVLALRGADIDTGMFHPRRLPHLRHAIANAAAIAVVSADKVAKVRALGATSPVAVVPNSIDLESWQVLPSDAARAQRLRCELVPADDALVVAAIGHLKRKKGIGRLARAIVELELMDDVVLLLAGDATAEEQAQLDALAEDGLRIHQLPFVDRDRLLGILPAADVVALPSIHDGMPNVMLEAGGLGLPLLASRAGGMGDHLQDGVHAWMFDPGDETGLRHAVWRMVQERARAPEMGAAWHARVQERFAGDAENRAWRAVLDAGCHNADRLMTGRTGG